MASGYAKYQLYLHWANSVLVEEKQSIQGLTELQDGQVLATILDILWPSAKLTAKIEALEEKTPEKQIQVILDYLSSIGIKHTLTDKDVLEDDLKKLHELIWLVILNFSIHTPKLTAFQRNVRMGNRYVLNWCREHVPSMTINHTDTLVNNVKHDGALIDLLTKLCVNISHHLDTVIHLENCLKACEEQYGVKKAIVNAELMLQGKLSEEALLIYLTLLKRKVKQRETQLALTSNRRELIGVPAPSKRLGMSTQSVLPRGLYDGRPSMLATISKISTTPTVNLLKYCRTLFNNQSYFQTTMDNCNHDGDSHNGNLNETEQNYCESVTVHDSKNIETSRQLETADTLSKCVGETSVESITRTGDATDCFTTQTSPDNIHSDGQNIPIAIENEIEDSQEMADMDCDAVTCVNTEYKKENVCENDITASLTCTGANNVGENSSGESFISKVDVNGGDTDSESVKLIDCLENLNLLTSEEPENVQNDQPSEGVNLTPEISVSSEDETFVIPDSVLGQIEVISLEQETLKIDELDLVSRTESEISVEQSQSTDDVTTSMDMVNEEKHESESDTKVACGEAKSEHSVSGCNETGPTSGTVMNNNMNVHDERVTHAEVGTTDSSAVAGCSELDKRRTASVCESVVTDDADTDAGYQASESSGVEDTGYEEGETDATYVVTSDDQAAPFRLVQRVVNVVQPGLHVVQPAVNAVQPSINVVQPEANVVQPAFDVVQPVLQPVGNVVQPVENVVQPVLQPVGNVVQPVENVVQPVVLKAQTMGQPVIHEVQSMSHTTQTLVHSNVAAEPIAQADSSDPHLPQDLLTVTQDIDANSHRETTSISSVREIDDISLAITDRLSGTPEVEATNDLDTTCATSEEENIAKRLSTSEISDAPSSVSISMETVQRHLTFSRQLGQQDSRNRVSLYMELAEAEQLPDAQEDGRPAEGQPKPCDDDNIEDAEAMVEEHKQLVRETGPNLISTVSASEYNIDQTNNDYLALSANSLFNSANEELLRNGIDNAIPEVSQQQQLLVDQTISEIINDAVSQSLDGLSNSDNADVCNTIPPTVEDLMSDVTSGRSTPVSAATVFSTSSDELLQLLDKISVSGYTMRTELDIAYARQAFIRELGNKMEQAGSTMLCELQQELEALRVQNLKLIDELKSYKSRCQQSGQKVHKFESLINQLQTHIEELELGIAEEKVQRQQRICDLRNIGVGTDACSINSVAVQTSSDISALETEFTDGLVSPPEMDIQDRTSTPSKRQRSPLNVSQVSCLHGSVELEGDETVKKQPSRVSMMIDKILHQMNNLTASADASLNNSHNNSHSIHDNSFNSQEVHLEYDSEPEGPEKWRRLSMTPINSDPNILTLQRSLASASFENELLLSKVKKGDKAQNRKIEKLTRDLEECKKLLQKAQEECEVLNVKSDGDKGETDLLNDKIASLEKSLSLSQEENRSLVAQLDGHLAPGGPAAVDDAARLIELEQDNSRLLDAKVQLQNQLQLVVDAKNKLEQDVKSDEEDKIRRQTDISSLQQTLTGQQSEKDLLHAEVLVLRQEYNYLRQGMTILDKCLGLDIDLSSEGFAGQLNNQALFADSGVTELFNGLKQDCVSDSSLNGQESSEQQSDPITSPVSLNSCELSQVASDVKCEGKVIPETTNVPQNCDSNVNLEISSQNSELQQLTESQNLTNVNTVTAEVTKEENNMAFPIHKAHIDELKRHVFGWRQYCAGKGQAQSIPQLNLNEPYSQVMQPFNGTPASLPPMALSLPDSLSAAEELNFGTVRNSTPRSASLNSSMTQSTLQSHGSNASTTSGGSTLHDDIMKQSEMVLDIIKESGDIREEMAPPAVFHWQDVRNSIAHHLLNESHQKVETASDVESVQDQNISGQDSNLTMLLQELDRHLIKGRQSQAAASQKSLETKKEEAKQIPDTVKVLMQALEKELGGTVDIAIRGKDGKELKLTTTETIQPNLPISTELINAEMLAEREDIDRRKETYRQEFDRVNSEYEELRKKRLSLLVQAYTGKQDLRPLTAKANSDTTEKLDTGNNISLEKMESSKSAIERKIDQEDFTSRYMTSHNRVQRDLMAMTQADNEKLPVCTPDSRPDPKLKEQILSSKVNQTISAISQDSQIIKDRIRAMREQLTAAEEKRAAAMDYDDVYRYEEEQDSYAADIMEDEPDDRNPYRSPRKRQEAMTMPQTKQTIQSPKPNRMTLLSGPRRQIYPHKKLYENSAAYNQRKTKEQDKENQELKASLDHLDQFMDNEKDHLLRQAQEQGAQREEWYDLGQEDYFTYPRSVDNSYDVQNGESLRRNTSESDQLAQSAMPEHLAQSAMPEHSAQSAMPEELAQSAMPEVSDVSTRERLERSIKELHDHYRQYDDDLSKKMPNSFKAVQKYEASLRSKTADMRRTAEPHEQAEQLNESMSSRYSTHSNQERFYHESSPYRRETRTETRMEPLSERLRPATQSSNVQHSRSNRSSESSRMDSSREYIDRTPNKQHDYEQYSNSDSNRYREKSNFNYHDQAGDNASNMHQDDKYGASRQATSSQLSPHAVADKLHNGSYIANRTPDSSFHRYQDASRISPRQTPAPEVKPLPQVESLPRQLRAHPISLPQETPTRESTRLRDSRSTPLESSATPESISRNGSSHRQEIPKWTSRQTYTYPQPTSAYNSQTHNNSHLSSNTSKIEYSEDRTHSGIREILPLSAEKPNFLEDRLNDSVHSLDSCNCAEVDTRGGSYSSQSYQNPRIISPKTEDKPTRSYHSQAGNESLRMDSNYENNSSRSSYDNPKRADSSYQSNSSNYKPHQEEAYDNPKCVDSSYQSYSSNYKPYQEDATKEGTIPKFSKKDSVSQAYHGSPAHITMETESVASSKQSEDGESTSTSDADFVVTKGGDILKRPRSATPTQGLRPDGGNHSPKTVETKQELFPDLVIPDSSKSEKPDYEYSRILDDSTSRYCEAVISEMARSPQRDSNGDYMRWTEPKRHFGIRETKGKEVRWADHTGCDGPSEEQVSLNERSYTNSTLASAKTDTNVQKSESPNDDNSCSQCGSQGQLTEEQRKYANELINRYTLNAEREKKKISRQPAADSGEKVPVQEKPDLESVTTKSDNISREEQTKFVNEILHKYGQEQTAPGDQRSDEPAAKVKKVSFSLDNDNNDPDGDTVKVVLHNVSEADEIIKKYTQQISTSEVTSSTISVT